MDTTVDLLKIKIDKAMSDLPEETRDAINAIDWKKTILELRTEKGYSFTQLEDLETETELLLCGLLEPEDYQKELEKRMGISKPQTDELINELNEKIFKKIKEQLVKNVERNKTSENNKTVPEKTEGEPGVSDVVLSKDETLESKEELLKIIENPQKTPSILTQKLSSSFQIPKTETEHTIGNLTKSSGEEKISSPKVDPYRMPTE